MTKDPATIIEALRKQYGKRLSILAHHYQHDDVARHADHMGDSLELARKIKELDSEYIVFCGVYFMAETAAVLAKPGQKIFIPDASASCSMSEMAPVTVFERALARLTETGRDYIGLTYVNSSAAVKAVCGRLGGSVCTSANAVRMLSWALDQGKGVIFLPDKMLAQNSANAIGLPEHERMILDIRQNGSRIDPEAAMDKKLLIWPGQCVIHSRFKADDIAAMRRREPDALFVVHPECHPDTVARADANGSTTRIINFVAEAPAGAVVYVGTEVNLVERLARQYKSTKTIKPLRVSPCSGMAKVTEQGLARQLANLENEPDVRVAPEMAESAGRAVAKMLEICAG